MNLLSSQPAGGNVAVIIVVCVIAALLIGWMIWQSIRNKKQQKEAQARVEALKPGDKIKTIGGICGYLISVNDKDNTFIMETGAEGKGTVMKFDKGAIYQIEPKNAPEKKEEAPVETKKAKSSKKAEKEEVKETKAEDLPEEEVIAEVTDDKAE